MAISDRSRKILWGRAANRCSICRKELVVDAALTQSESVFGEECHIVGPKVGSPRFDAEYPPPNVDEYVNRILLCSPHHKQVDDLEQEYPTPTLTLIKRRHEHWVRTTLGVDGGAFPSPIADILLTRFSLPVVFVFLVDAILSACRGVVSAVPTFDESRRELRLAARLRRRLGGLTALVATGQPDRRATLELFLQHSLDWLLVLRP